MFQPSVEGVAAQGGGVAYDDEFHACTGDGHVHASEVGEEPHLSLFVLSHHGDEDDVALLSLEPVHGVYGDKVAEGFPVGVLAEHLAKQMHLALVGGDDTDVQTLVQDAVLAVALYIVVQGLQGKFCFNRVYAAETVGGEGLTFF